MIEKKNFSNTTSTTSIDYRFPSPFSPNSTTIIIYNEFALRNAPARKAVRAPVCIRKSYASNVASDRDPRSKEGSLLKVTKALERPIVNSPNLFQVFHVLAHKFIPIFSTLVIRVNRFSVNEGDV